MDEGKGAKQLERSLLYHVSLSLFPGKSTENKGKKGGVWSNVIVVIIGNVGVVQETLGGQGKQPGVQTKGNG